MGIDKRLVSKQESYGTKNSLKYFIGYNDDSVIITLCIKLSQMIGYIKIVMIIRRCILRLMIVSY